MNEGRIWGLTSGLTIRIEESNDVTQVIVRGKLYMIWKSGDEATLRMAIVQLYRTGLGTQERLAKVFKRHVNSIRKYLTDYRTNGAMGLSLLVQDLSPNGR